MTEAWTPVSIRHLDPRHLVDPYTFSSRISTGDGEDLTQWLHDNQMIWTLAYDRDINIHTYTLLFQREEDATLFKLRWSS